MKTIFKSVKINRQYCIWLFLFVFLSAIGQMLLPALLSMMINHGVTLGKYHAIKTIAVIMIAVTVVSCGISYGTVKLSAIIATDFASQLRNLVFGKIVNFSAMEMDQFGGSSLITRCTSDISNVQNFLTLVLRVGLLAPLMAFAGLIFSSSTGGKVSFVLLIAIPVLFVSLSIIIVFAAKYSTRLRNQLDQINKLFLENLEGVRVIRAFNKQKWEMKRFHNSNYSFMKTAIKAGRITSCLMPSISLIFGVTTAVVLGVGAYYVQIGSMEVGSLVANSQYISMVLTAVMMVSMVIMMIPTSVACGRRISEVLTTTSAMEDGHCCSEQRPLRGTLEFKDVTFAYPQASEPVIKGISFTAKPGEVTAIIGGTGRGKSSIVKLIPRLYDPLFGEILIDGINIKDYSMHDLRNLISYVPQKNNLFSGTIASNLNFGNSNGNASDWEFAAHNACTSEFIESKANGYCHEVAQGGTNFSGGQKQRLAIARALMKKAEIYVFDDSFSALDMATDRKLRNNLNEILTEATVIIVAQRISTIRHADRILVVDDGQIVGNGNHEQLMKSCPLYQEMALLQMGKEFKDEA